jgi:hypothetical protein
MWGVCGIGDLLRSQTVSLTLRFGFIWTFRSWIESLKDVGFGRRRALRWLDFAEPIIWCFLMISSSMRVARRVLLWGFERIDMTSQLVAAAK